MTRGKRRLEWVDELSSGDVALDAQHREFLRQSNDFFDMLAGPERFDIFERVLGFLTDYSRNHFSAQEAMMESTLYPGLAEHVAEHKSFIRRISLLYKQLLIQKRPNTKGEDNYDPRGLDGVIHDTADFIFEWYDDHLIKTDKRLSDYLKFEHGKQIR